MVKTVKEPSADADATWVYPAATHSMFASSVEFSVTTTRPTRSLAPRDTPVNCSDRGVLVSCAVDTTVTCDTNAPMINGPMTAAAELSDAVA